MLSGPFIAIYFIRQVILHNGYPGPISHICVSLPEMSKRAPTMHISRYEEGTANAGHSSICINSTNWSRLKQMESSSCAYPVSIGAAFDSFSALFDISVQNLLFNRHCQEDRDRLVQHFLQAFSPIAGQPAHYSIRISIYVHFLIVLYYVKTA